jgi:high-affinity nickel-transport protein
LAASRRWALGEPSRKRGYNIAITAGSVVVALGVGLAEGLGLLAGPAPWLPAWIAALNDNADLAGGLIVGGFALLWIGALGIGLVSERNRRQGKLLAS